MNRILHMSLRVRRAIPLNMRLTPGFVMKWWFRKWYDLQTKRLSGEPKKFNTYGYVPLTEDEKRGIATVPKDDEYFCMLMYHHVVDVDQIELENADVLEVGCGRGGGCHYIKRFLKARRVVGIDISKINIDYCRKYSAFNDVAFLVGDAEKIPFDDKSFDVVVNIESSHHYPNIDRFFKEVDRILKPNGHFLFADLWSTHLMEKLKEKLRKCNLKIVSENDITANVLESRRQASKLGVDRLRKISRNEEDFKNMLDFGALEGSESFRKFQDREKIYVSFVIQNGFG
jgi:ubiquinone/menaquinone biosynthesis C-methylase UbiE